MATWDMPGELVILVDADDHPLGTMEKMRAHAEGRLHRAFSVFVFDRAGRLLMQRRAASKYHSAGLWSNTCCGHPRPGEPVDLAADRRLFEEMGFRSQLREIFSFVYRVELDRQMVEHEVDHVLVAESDGSPSPNPAEVDDWKWIDLPRLRDDIARQPEAFTSWLRILIAHGGYRRALEQASRSD